MSISLYGIPNCNTVKKAIDWLNANNVAFEFHNFKKSGITKTLLNDWCGQVAWEVLLNKKGTTWRKLSEVEQASATNAKNVVALLAEHTSMIKRPVITQNGKIVAVGFDEAALDRLK